MPYVSSLFLDLEKLKDSLGPGIMVGCTGVERSIWGHGLKEGLAGQFDDGFIVVRACGSPDTELRCDQY